MAFYIIHRQKPGRTGEIDAVLISAKSEKDARDFAARSHGSEGPDTWHSPYTIVTNLSTIVERSKGPEILLTQTYEL